MKQIIDTYGCLYNTDLHSVTHKLLVAENALFRYHEKQKKAVQCVIWFNQINNPNKRLWIKCRSRCKVYRIITVYWRTQTHHKNTHHKHTQMNRWEDTSWELYITKYHNLVTNETIYFDATELLGYLLKYKRVLVFPSKSFCVFSGLTVKSISQLLSTIDRNYLTFIYSHRHINILLHVNSMWTLYPVSIYWSKGDYPNRVWLHVWTIPLTIVIVNIKYNKS